METLGYRFAFRYAHQTFGGVHLEMFEGINE
jgi:hypothetical protein